MALENTDLFITQRPASGDLYKLRADVLQTKLADGSFDETLLVWNGANWVPSDMTGVPIGTTTDQMLKWNGTEWEVTDQIDGGEYAT